MPNQHNAIECLTTSRRNLVSALAVGVAATTSSAEKVCAKSIDRNDGWINLKGDYNAVGDGIENDTRNLQDAINHGAESQRPILIPPGCYKITRPLSIPSNTMLIGSAPGLGFGCRIEPMGCTAFLIGGAKSSFHCSIESLMIWPKGEAPDSIISIDNSYSITFRNIRIHETQKRIKSAAIMLLGDRDAGGHGKCNNIIWDNLIVRNDGDQPGVAVLAAKGCGSHRFINPCIENFGTLLDWRGGQLDLVTPYTERAGRFGVDCNLSATDNTAYLNTYGGVIAAADSGLGCAIRETTNNFNSFGTHWGESERAAYVYGLPRGPVNFHGISPNFAQNGKSQFSGIAGWRSHVNFLSQAYKLAKPLSVKLASGQHSITRFAVPGVTAGDYSVRASINADLRGLHLTAYVSNVDEVTTALWNPTKEVVHLNGVINISCELM